MNKREHILHTTAQMIMEHGVSRLSLAKVANQAGVSKGGLLHYFKTKDELFYQLNVLAIEEFNSEFERLIKVNPDEKGKYIKAYAQATLNDLESSNGSVNSSFVASFTDSPEIMELWKGAYLEWQQKCKEDDLDWKDVATIRFVCDGLWFNNLLNINDILPYSKELLQNLIDNLEKE